VRDDDGLGMLLAYPHLLACWDGVADSDPGLSLTAPFFDEQGDILPRH
jgi:hypothetical protein